jgi:hypothetical protein
VIATQIFPIRDRMKCVETTAGPGRVAAAEAFAAPESLTGPAIALGANDVGAALLGAAAFDAVFAARAFPAVLRPFLRALAAFTCFVAAFIPAIAAY